MDSDPAGELFAAVVDKSYSEDGTAIVYMPSGGKMEMWMLGTLFAPLGALIIFGVIALSIKWAIATLMPDCALKRALLAERWKSKCSSANRRVLEQAARHTRGYRS